VTKSDYCQNWLASEVSEVNTGRRPFYDCQFKYVRNYTAKNDINIFKTRSYLEAFTRNEIADESTIMVLTSIDSGRDRDERDFSWCIRGEYCSARFEIVLKIDSRKGSSGKPDPCSVIRLKLFCRSPKDRFYWDELMEKVGTFLAHGYHDHSKWLIPVEISLKNDFSVHDGGQAFFWLKYGSDKKEIMNLWSQWYTPLDAQEKWGGYEQDILESYLRRIMLLEAYH